MIKEFKEFISRGNVIELSVGIIMGGAFGKIVTSLVNDILMPLIGIALGGLDLSSLVITIGDSKILYGSFLKNILDFLIIAFAIFFIIKTLNKFNKKKKEEEKKEIISEEVKVLKEIKALLKKQK